jgi:hypothetical protein
MAKAKIFTKTQVSAGDAAVTGLFSGLQGGAAMAGIIVLFSILNGQGLSYLGYFSAGEPIIPLVGLVTHLAVSSIYGMLYALGRRLTGLDRRKLLPGWAAGLVFALGLWLIAVVLFLPAAKSLLLTLPWVVFLTGHIIYGLVVGLRQKP